MLCFCRCRLPRRASTIPAGEVIAMSTNSAGKCAACGKESNSLKTCTACKLVKYCDAACQRAHRPKHARECRARADAILQESLFEDPPPREECSVCFLPLPLGPDTSQYQVCCGKMICSGCVYGVTKSGVQSPSCPFCRSPVGVLLSDDEWKVAIEKRMNANDFNAFNHLGLYYRLGQRGVMKDQDKAIRLWLRAGKLGSADAYQSLGYVYFAGEGAKRDLKKAKHCYMLAAIGGDMQSRHNLGVINSQEGDINRAMKHFSISAEAGWDASLEIIRERYLGGQVSKAGFEKALRAHKKATDEMRSEQQEAVALFFQNVTKSEISVKCRAGQLCP